MKLISLVLFCLILNNSYAFDGKRSGLQLSLGVGAGKISGEFSSGSSLEETAITYGFKIGYGFGEKFSLFLEKESRFYEFQGTDILNEITGIGLKLYLTPRFFVFGAGGIGGYLNEITIDPSDSVIGSGYFYGVGFDLLKNISIELSHSSLSIDQTELNKKGIISPNEQSSTNLLFFFNFF